MFPGGKSKKDCKKTPIYARGFHLLSGHINVRTPLCREKYDYDAVRPSYCPLFDFFSKKPNMAGVFSSGLGEN